jgi:hypothetical protein
VHVKVVPSLRSASEEKTEPSGCGVTLHYPNPGPRGSNETFAIVAFEVAEYRARVGYFGRGKLLDLKEFSR